MAQTIVTYCDPCLARGEEVPARTWSVSLLAPGARKPASYDLDACETCAKTFVDLGEFLAGNARPGGSIPPLYAPSKPSRDAEPKSVADLTCPVCQHVSGRPGGLNSHVQSEHGMTVGEARGEATLPCQVDGCERKFTAPQGLAAHHRSAHPGVEYVAA